MSRIDAIKDVRVRKSEISEEENILTKPILTDLSRIEEIYSIFKESLLKRDCAPRIESVSSRKKFIFIILYIYSPSTLAGGKMNDGVRDALAKVCGVVPTVISHNMRDVSFIYQHYHDERDEIDYIYQEILDRLRIS